ncbi:hypothetical protein SAMN05216389_11254 [Oceanobacillus limi]|uniref:Uncharacterized protein n=1 Tax=Oceanobacillus limi TaxID=930131 RepID=A0A1I0ERM8_9BACI|nr:hypothetical protein [Oceanobacillus limi]SET47746.1 hypothetical protein SAMN05216389_11254 [Oceanobacillus limi]
MKGLYKGLIGAVIGGATAGFWLMMDLVLPEPIGDYLLFGMMGIVNAIIGWQVARVVGKREEAVKQRDGSFASSSS